MWVWTLSPDFNIVLQKRIGIKVQKSSAEKVRKFLLERSLLDKNLRVKRTESHVVFPLSREPSSEDLQTLKEIADVSFVVENFEKVRIGPRSIKEVLAGKIPEDALAEVRRSFDIIGDIAVIEVPQEVMRYGEEIGRAIMRVHKNVRAVFAKVGPVDTEFRVRKLIHIAGDKRTTTIHREHGCLFYVDVANVYFSPRLSTEHLRVASQVSDNEVVIDMFTGVGPFAILIAKRTASTVFAIDKNPHAIECLRRNIELNKLKGEVIPLLGDARDIVPSRLRGKATRVIMNLPLYAHQFIDVACIGLRSEGGIVHFYTITGGQDPKGEAVEILRKGVERSGRILEEILSTRVVREYAPRKWQVVVDGRIR